MAVAISRMSRQEKLLLELYKRKPPSLVIGKEIDRGANGVVLDGTFEGRRVAIKKLNKILLDTAVTDEEVERLIRDFKKETDMLKSIRHPHVVQVLGAFYDPETREPILVMEKMAKNLRKYLEENKGLKELKQIHICLQIALGVQFLHHLTPPLAHKDLTDKNVLIADDGTVKIGDLVQSKYKDLKDVYFGTEVSGAFLFMAPETAKPSGSDKAHYTESVDIFSLGVLALEIATQSYPTPSLHGFGVLTEVKRRESDLKKMGDGHPLKPLVLKCLENNYEKRPVITHIVDNLVVLIVEDYMGNTELSAKLDEAEEGRRKLSKEVTGLKVNMDVDRKEREDLRKQLQNVSGERDGLKRYSKSLEQSVDGFEYIIMDQERQNLQLMEQITDLQRDLVSHQTIVDQKEVQIKQREEFIRQLESQACEMMEEINKLEAENNLLKANAITQIGSSGESQAPLKNALGHEAQLVAKCWIPFGIQVLHVPKNGGTFSLEPSMPEYTDLENYTFRIEIPEDSITDDSLEVRYGIIFDGPLLLPDGYQLASPVVYVYFDHSKVIGPVTIYIPHCIARDEHLLGDSDNVPTVVAPHVMSEGRHMCEFAPMDLRDTAVNVGYSVVRLTGHNSLIGQAMRRSRAVTSYYASFWEMTHGSQYTLRVVIVYGIPIWIKVLKRYLPPKNWKMRVNEVPQPFQFKSDRIVGVLERSSGSGWEATVTPPAILQSSVQFKDYPTTKKMEEAVEEDTYPPSLRVAVIHHYPAHCYTATKRVNLAISETDHGTLIFPVNVLEVEGHPTLDSDSRYPSVTSPRDSLMTPAPASDFCCGQFMVKFKEQFLSVVAADAIAMRLKIDNILPDKVYHSINNANQESAREILFIHFSQEGTPSTIRTLCDVMMGRTGYPSMKALGEKMKQDSDLAQFL